MTALKNINKGRIPLLAVIVTGLVVFGLMATGVMLTGARAADRELRIGVLTSLKMECGQATINAVKMAIAKVNAKGGVLGRKLKLFVADSESSPEKGITGLKRLVEKDKVHVLLGGASSGVVLACMDYLKRYNKVFMSIGVSSPLIAKKVVKNYGRYKYQFRNIFNAINLAKFIIFDELALLVKLGYKRFAVLAEDAAWNRGLVGFLKKVLPKVGGQVVAVVRFDPQTADFAPVFSKIAASKAQVAIPLLAHTNTVSLYKQWSSMKAPFRMVGFNNPGTHAEYWKKTGGACLSEVNVVFGATIRAKITRKSIPFFDAYVRLYKTTPHGCASFAYDGTMVLIDAIRRAKSIKTGALIKALERTDYTGTAGRIVFDKKTHDAKFGPQHLPFLVTQWQAGGRWVVLWPKRFATSKFANPPWLK